MTDNPNTSPADSGFEPVVPDSTREFIDGQVDQGLDTNLGNEEITESSYDFLGPVDETKFGPDPVPLTDALSEEYDDLTERAEKIEKEKKADDESKGSNEPELQDMERIRAELQAALEEDPSNRKLQEQLDELKIQYDSAIKDRSNNL